ncbi:hypothetical protein LCGC14_0902320 [marine sediment metagenome]|uniref:Uncharacterized protein n=1 Tax=marine sediment metagenome TaxID=412755 RepID=A0A0F9PGT0_9ZZZZ
MTKYVTYVDTLPLQPAVKIYLYVTAVVKIGTAGYNFLEEGIK